MQSCGNPLFLQWISEWMQEAKEKNLKSYNVFKTAYNSLLSCPITFSDPRQLKKLKGIGNVISARLEERLKEYQRTHINSNVQNQANVEKSYFSQLEESHLNSKTIKKSIQQKTKTQTSKTYIPGYRSKSFAILIALFKFNEDATVSKEEILNIARHYYDISEHKNIHSLWNGMKILLEKEYVYKTVNPTRYHLTYSGKEVAAAISSSVFSNGIIEKDFILNNEFKKNIKETQENNYHEIHMIKELSQNIEMEKKTSKGIPKSPIHNTILNISTIQHNLYSIILLLDTREMKTQKDKEFIENYLTKESIVFEFRTLELGDVLWIARCNITKKEYILDFIVERKRLNDLASSIKDGRFHEQKFRLSKSCLKHVIYIIENCNYDFTDFNIEAIHSAISSTQIINGFFVKRLSGLMETIKYIIRLTRYISQIYKTQDLYIIDNDNINLQTYTLQKKIINSTYPERSYVIEYSTFSDFLSKTASLTLGDLFLKMLLTIKGVSPEKAIEIQKRFPTLNDLLTSYYKETSEYEREMMISKKCTNYGRKNISPLLSSKIYKVFK
ncbi:hypothetical protein T552_03069 [Pneumocystis carinii B80]|uniref:Crossover junction endonuclease MUS81 n=1 Tax=Pneumocystis carinii (strain B80) TaxID=1408658 RepID=A0A0W4ZCM7_PNEC8|nr:hypothetical protein T552_03069 [Pneumocystis carinii B80]KTW26178.1 hypothetical protein T552_03069 [Pneumocystis carinii B80]